MRARHQGTEARRHEGKGKGRSMSLFPFVPSCLRAIVPFLLCLPGCITTAPQQANSRPVTDIDPRRATPEYWLAQPAVAQVAGADFYKLWNACRAEVHDRFFVIDREAYRQGVLTTEPLVSKQFFEPWRRDAVTIPDIANSTLGTIRRSVRFQLSRRPDGGFIAEPRVLIERYSSAERRLTAMNEYHTAFSGPRPFGDAQTDEGIHLPSDYWYTLGRDAALEKDLVKAIGRRLGLQTPLS